MTAVRCDNCDWTGDEEVMGRTLLEVHQLAERLNPGSIVPHGECPECGAFCYATTTRYTVLLRYPDYLSDCGTETYLAHVEAKDVGSAQRLAQAIASGSEEDDAQLAFAVLMVCEGFVNDIKED